MTASAILGVGLATTGACSPVSPTSPSVAEGWDGGGGGGGDADAAFGGDSRGTIAADAGACLPGDVATYQPSYHPPLAPSAACGPQAIQGFFEACLDTGASVATCSSFQQAHPKCAACLLTPDSAPSYGPVVDHGTFVTANVAGCIELVASGDVACARAVQALAGCELAACQANCDVHDAVSLRAFDACAGAADSGGCAGYASAASCVAAGDAGVDASSPCLSSDFGQYYRYAAALFCAAPPPPDAGSSGPPPDAGAGD